MLSAHSITSFAVAILLSFAITYSSLMAQTTLRSTVLGVVTDSQGASISGARCGSAILANMLSAALRFVVSTTGSSSPARGEADESVATVD
jgi:hypothetical protein